MIGVLVRVLVAAVFVVVIVRFGYGAMRSYVHGALREADDKLAGPPPSVEVAREGVGFRCAECGLEVLLTRVPDTEEGGLKPLRHCREEMSLVEDVST